MTFDIFAGIKFNDGQEVKEGDLNDAVRFLSARLHDQIIQPLIAGLSGTDQEFSSENGANPATSWAYALSPGAANPKQGSTNAKIKIGAGTLLQKVRSTDGANMSLLSYTFPGTDEVTIAAGDGANPRVDLVLMKLELADDDLQSRVYDSGTPPTVTLVSQNMYMKNRVKCTLTVLQGTPAAAPAYPVATAGYVPICAVVVPTLYAAGGVFIYAEEDDAANFGVTHPVIHDLRIPVGVQAYQVYAVNGIYDPSIWGRSNSTPSRRSMYHGDGPFKTIEIPAADAVDHTLSHTRLEDHFQFAASVNVIEFPIVIPAGSYIKSWVVHIDKVSDNTNTVTGELWTTPGGTGVKAAVPASSTTLSTNSDHFSTLFGTTGSWVVNNSSQYWLRVTPSGNIGSGADLLYSVKITYVEGGGVSPLFIPCPVKTGRLIGVDVCSQNKSTSTAYLSALLEPGGYEDPLVDISSLLSASTPFVNKHGGMSVIEVGPVSGTGGGPTVTGNGTHAPPIWCNGKRSMKESRAVLGGDAPASSIGVYVGPTPALGTEITMVTFYVAEGL